MPLFVLLLVLLSPPAPPEAKCYAPPVTGVVTKLFVQPACPYCSGHRGLEYATTRGSGVRAVAQGVVSFVGPVVGILYVVVDQSDGLLATYGMLQSANVHRGDQIVAGQVIAATTVTFYFGLRRDGVYIDPFPFLGVRRVRPRLVPVDGTMPRPPRVQPLTC